MEENEPPEAGCLRELMEETGLTDVRLWPLMFYGDVNRDPRYRLISLSFMGLTRQIEGIEAATDAKQLRWSAPTEVGELAFDHNKLMSDAIRRLRHEANYTNIAKHLLPENFTLSTLQKLYEELFLQRLDKRNFRRKLNTLKAVEKVPGEKKNLYRFKSDTSFNSAIVG